jgi:CheY-like chemotaxis protein
VQFLESVSKELANRFEIVAAVTDGRQAVNDCERLDPDAVVLDITMPELDGFQTLRALKRMESRAKVVLLTMHAADEYVLEAIRSGVDGYVLKTRTRSDLVTALDHALAGRVFMPALSPLALAGRCAHTVQFYADAAEFHDSTAHCLSTALGRGDTVAVIFTETDRKGIGRQLQARGWDLAQLEEQGRYLDLDSEEAVSQVMRDGLPDLDCFVKVLEDFERARLASVRGPQSRMTVCGAMAGLLWQRGELEAALQVERIWDGLSRTLPYFTVCAYAHECHGFDPPPELLADICAQHTVVSHA